MNVYDIFKFLHVVTAIAWVGGGGVILLLGIIAAGANNDADVFTIGRFSNQLAFRWFIPSSLLTLVFGVIATTLAGLWSEAWIIIALVGFLATFTIGMTVMKPAADTIAMLSAADDHAGAMAETRRVLQINKFDATILLVVVADMVLKPTWADLIPIAIMVLVLVAAATLFLSPMLRSRTA
jgi:uncharacterized membrane protein